MIPVNKLVEVFYTMLGWPYVTPGTSNAKGIDCSGAFVYAYRQFGAPTASSGSIATMCGV